jgi:hypothetical protein
MASIACKVLKSNKNDFIDAEASAESATMQNMRFVQIRPRSNSIGRPCTAWVTDRCSVALIMLPPTANPGFEPPVLGL